MTAEISMLLVLALSPAVNFLIHAVCTRVLPGRPPQAVALAAVLIGYLPASVLLWTTALHAVADSGRLLAAGVYCWLVYSALAYTYFHFFNMSETARRIRILYEIRNAGYLSAERLTSLYRSKDILSIRLQRLVAIRQVACTDGYYSLRGKTLYLAGHLVLLWRKMLGLDREP